MLRATKPTLAACSGPTRITASDFMEGGPETSRAASGSGFGPASVFLYEAYQGFRGLFYVEVLRHATRTDALVDVVGSASHIAEVRVGQLSGSVDDAPHDGDGNGLEMGGALADLVGRGL